MTSASPEYTPRPQAVPKPRRRPAAPARAGGSGLFTVLWLLFLAVMIFDPGRLDAVWLWFRELPVVAQVVGWVLLLPLMIGLVIWQAPWALWVRVTLIVLLAVVNIGAFSRRAGG